MGTSMVIEAELHGITMGLQYAHDKGFRKINLQIDNKVIFNSIKKNDAMTLSSKEKLRPVMQLLNMDWEVKIHHIFYEINKCANALVNFSLHHCFDRLLYEFCPHQIYDIMLTDSFGDHIPRVFRV